jgi:PAS domain S-box-containing protein
VAVQKVFALTDETTEQTRSRPARATRLASVPRRRRLSELSDLLRGCETVAAISSAVSEFLGSALACTRTGYAILKGEHTIVEADWTDGTVASLSGRHEFSALGSRYAEHMTRDDVLVIDDVKLHPATAENHSLWIGIGVRALVNVPLLENGRLMAMVYAHQSAARHWTSDEVRLVQDVADRAWEAMGRARAVEALRRVNDGLEATVEERTLQRDRLWALSTDLMMVSNRSGVILSVNPAWTLRLGWREEELVGSPFTQFLHPDDVTETLAIRGTILDGAVLEKFVNRYLTRDGQIVWLSWTAVPDGPVIHSVGRDVTAEREQAEALKAAEEALRHAQKMEAVGQLTGGIAHDFNNLLQGIVGALQLSDMRIAEGRLDGLARYNAQAQHCAERAAALTHRLLAFSRRQALDPKPVRANELILGMEPLLRRTLGESIRLELDLAPDLSLTLCDPNQLDSAILNLAINARDAMPDGGLLTISSVNTTGLSGRADAEAICISVTDTGTGMPPEVAARAFDPFYTTKPLGQGTGLGLSMIYGFMRQSGGEAKISSQVGTGTTVSLRLERYVGADVCELPDPPRGPMQTAGAGTALVLEDEPAVRLFVIEALEQRGFQVIAAADGPSALDIVQSARALDLLVTDIGLPGINGRQVAEVARATRPSLKILFMTGYAETAAASEGFLGPGMGLITKPFRVEGLELRIAQLIQG